MGSKEVQWGGPTMDEVAQQSRWKTDSLSGPSLGSHSIRVGVGQSGKDNATLAALEATRTAETAGKNEMEDVD